MNSNSDEGSFLDDEFDIVTPECVLHDGKPCFACERQSELLMEIEAAGKALDSLLAEERRVRAAIKRYHNSDRILTIKERGGRQNMNPYHDPFQRFPPEVTSHIFCLTLPEFKRAEFAFDGAEFALTLGAVCKAWRTIAWSTPRLWTEVMLTVRGVPTRNQIAVAEEWIERSRQLGLTVQLSFEECDGNPGEEELDMFQMFVDVLNAQSHRWETLTLKAPGWLSRLFTGNEIGAPMLKTLQLSTEDASLEDSDDDDDVGGFALRAGKPRPDYVFIKMPGALDSVEISWNNVTDAIVWSISLEDSMKLLRRAPTLVNLRLKNILYQGSSRPIHGLPHLLHRLRHLSISPDTLGIDTPPPNDYSTILDQVTLPSLESLGVHSPYQIPVPLIPNSLKGFLDRSSISLTTFKLFRVTCDLQAAVDVLYALPACVKTIKLDIMAYCGTKDLDISVLFDHLSGFRSPAAGPRSESLLPNLETFEYHIFRATRIPWRRLPSLLRPASGGQRPFRKLTIVDRNCMDRRSFLTKRMGVTQSVVRELIKFKEDGVELFLPREVSFDHLSALLCE